MSDHAHTSRHLVNGEVIEVPRGFAPEHIAAGYHLADWSAHSTPDHELLGTYETDDGELVVRHLEAGPTDGPEFEIETPDGGKITTLHEDAVRFHLEQFGARSGA